MKSQRKGFTLIELLIVIGILAVLATITILVLNPAQLFAQGRDSQRIADLGTARSAISLYLATVSSPDLDAAGTCATNFWGTIASAPENFSGSPTQHGNVGREVDGTGWIPVNLTNVPGGSPLPALPVDPVNSTTYAYTYQCDASNLTFELNAIMESARYANSGSDDVESTDGGDSADVYEIGSDPDLDL